MNIFKTLLYTLFIFTSLLSSAETEILYLSGTGSDDTIEWDFMVTGGRKANEWSKISVPSNWELQGFGEYNYGHDMPKGDEKGIYKTTFHVPPHWADKTIFIVFQGSMTDTEVKINGQSAGPVHQGGFYSFSYNISDLIDIEGGNSLEVTVAKMSANESINMAERRSDYWVFGGIFRPVYLKAVPREHISWTAIDGRAEGQFIINVYLQNIRRGDNIKAQIFDKSGRYVGQPMIGKITSGTEKISLSTTISQPQTWSAESPHLYYVGVTLNQGENVIHSIREQFGFRTFEVRDGEGLFLNGNRITLKGVNRHSFWPTTGRTLNYSLCLQDIQTMKEMNMNAVRMSHYPPDNYFLDLCDEYGLYVLDELAGWQKPPYDTPTGERLVKEMVMRDVNHPSILFWDNGNEGGWNTELDDEWDKYDPQLRRVLHPWELHGGVDTDHYENYRSTLNKHQQGHIFMPTEHLHGLYDGGLGAGLDDYWKAMWGHPLTGGMFLWVFADEGVVRTDLNGIIDTDGNHAPDGILGPFHEREASFYTIKEIWSPVYIESLDDLPAGFVVPLENRFDFINLNLCFFEWKLVNFVKPSERTIGSREIARGILKGPDIPPRSKGILKLILPEEKHEADALHLMAFDPELRELYTWKWKLKNSAEITGDFIIQNGLTPKINAESDWILVDLTDFKFYIDKTNGRIMEIRNGSKTIPFGNGPVFTNSDDQTNSVLDWEFLKTENSVILKGKNHPDFSNLVWTFYGSGWVKLDYTYQYEGKVDYLGVSFDFPEKHTREIRYLAKGPYPVWKNRLKGQTVDVYFNTYKNFKVNTAWEYPEFVGYFAEFNWAVLYTNDGPITMATDNDDLFLRLFSQENGNDSRYTAKKWPKGDFSFLHAIPSMGTKFNSPERLGPQGEKFEAKGNYSGILYFYFGEIPE